MLPRLGDLTLMIFNAELKNLDYSRLQLNRREKRYIILLTQ